ncbi:hypothetical protein ACQ4M3_01065 [Leptolyngbya sp. AN03gr2]|uniref:hypothetical protein n=1 Tax=unclassified Leptolyngbya TaxID=2650499 RepID=UPI003D311A97
MHPTPNFSIGRSGETCYLSTTYTTDLGNERIIEIAISDAGVNIPATETLNNDGLSKFLKLLTIAANIKQLGEKP